MSNLYKFPSKFVYWEKIKNHSEVKKNILPSILEHSEKLNNSLDENGKRYCEKFKCKTNYFTNDTFLINLFKKYEYEDTIIWNVIDNLLTREDLKLSRLPKSSNISQIWYNIYSPGGYHNVHIHNGYVCGFSGIYILDLHENNPTKFYNSGNLFFDNTFTTDELDEGTVIIFPNNLEHYVEPCLKNRITISFNIFSKL